MEKFTPQEKNEQEKFIDTDKPLVNVKLEDVDKYAAGRNIPAKKKSELNPAEAQAFIERELKKVSGESKEIRDKLKRLGGKSIRRRKQLKSRPGIEDTQQIILTSDQKKDLLKAKKKYEAKRLGKEGLLKKIKGWFSRK